MRVINQSQMYNLLPSQVLKIEDEYTAFCFDEACMYIIGKIRDEEETPLFREDIKENSKKSFLDIHMKK